MWKDSWMRTDRAFCRNKIKTIMWLLLLLLSCVLSISIFGLAGSGKSALISKLCNISVDSSSSRETTLFSRTYSVCNLTDTPGFGTRQFPVKGHFEKYWDKDKVAVLVVTQRIFEQHYTFVSEVGTSAFLLVLRTQIDIFPVNANDLIFIRDDLDVDIVLPVSIYDSVTMEIVKRVLSLIIFHSL